MKVSVIVPNNNRDTSVLRQSLEFENVSYIEVNEGFERSKQRNMGIDRASGEYFLFLDSDQSIETGLIEECKRLCENGISAVYIPEIIVARSFFGRIRAFERTFYTGTAVDVPRFVRAQGCPLFDESLNGPEDADWGNRISGKREVSKCVLFHHDDITLSQYIRKKAYYTKSMKRYAQKWPNDPCLNLKYRCWTVFTEKDKWERLLGHPILTLGIIVILIIRGIIYVTQR